MEAVKQDSDSNQSFQLKPNSSQNAPIGEGTVLLGRYMLMRVIGQGGTSFVYRVRDLLAVLGGDEAESHVAIKVVRVTEGAEQHESQLMLREALSTRHLSHKNILKVYDFHRDDDVCFVTMELIEGESLADFLTRLPSKKMSYRRALPIIKAISSALQYAHDHGVIHSDIKPSNVLITERGEIKVIDFATARSYMDARVKGLKFDHDPKYYGYTLAYASPQTIADEPAKPSDDVFSFACIIYEMLTGKHPYGRKPTNTVAKNFKLNRPKEIGFAQWWVLRRALSLEATVRYPSVAQFTSLFVHAGKMLQYGAGVMCIAFLGIWGGSQMYGYTGDYFERAGNKDIAYKKLIKVDSWAEQIKALPVDERVAALKGLTALTPEHQQMVLALVYRDVVTALDERATRALNYSMPNEATPDFPKLVSQVKTALNFYPDSHALIAVSKRLELESEQLLSAFAIQLRGAWQNVEFNLADAKTISELISRLQHLNGDVSVSPNADVVERYRQAIASAVERADFQAIYELSVFADVLNQAEAFEQSWKKYDAAMPLAAKELIEYQLSADTSEAFPSSASTYFVEPLFSKLNKEIASAWLDKDILDLDEKLDDAEIRFGLHEADSLIVNTRKNLIEKVKSKMAYHQQKGNLKSLTQLQIVFDDATTASVSNAATVKN